MYVIDYLKPEGIFLNMKAYKKKEELFKILVRRACEVGLVPGEMEEPVLNELLAREAQSTTGIGEGIAIPHCKMEGLPHAVIIAATIPEGMKYGSVDGKPVRLLFSFLFPADQGTQYLQVLAKLSRILKEEALRNRLILSSSPEEFRNILAQADVVPLVKEGKAAKIVFLLCINEEGKEQEVSSSLVEVGAQTTVILETETLQKKLLYDIPIFAGVKFFHSRTPYSKTYMGILSSVEQADYLADLLKKQGIDLTSPGSGFLVAFEAGKVIGGIPEELDV
ncbi:putative PTS IIA-like nitrogen-regulatory protein PtsN [Spirochaeta thermophila DSM 6578]|uniref:PTS IIA-like nitrogen-regulatory protein PtsN n=1 Tax=Winmispira thermophila (strain ATCC 700085 / DSM 6578 / Z-1203) TaxID=869211 RepID=G0GG60_WINT7|nr:PTS sugar transporter subunit IIA [Spirochaeta thermophila]AEJ62536.1 putative PTS IIA-like nitrogen-regulatory protein PtsN [Spirochaeta thermophila DSM 6578]